ncbi:MAG TPA: hypothetical protein VHM70_21595 [Polyangiaceae bacterium]|jgi:hypothetical protein|nr:hypothetical protein [Polyangiaceae bacterium]
MLRWPQFSIAIVLSTVAFGSQLPRDTGTAIAMPASPAPVPSRVPLPNGCAQHLTRAADLTITMQPDTKFYKQTLDVTAHPPQSFQSSTPVVVAGGMPTGCKRSVVDIVVPTGVSSGCPMNSPCESYAELATGPAQFPNSKSWEENFFTMKDTVTQAYCLSYRHDVSIYKKAGGQTTFGEPVRTLVYRGYWENSKCKVRATYLGQVWDTAEIYASITPPTDGSTDVYRLVESLRIDNADRNIITTLEFEKKTSP